MLRFLLLSFSLVTFSVHSDVIINVEVPISIDKETTMQNARAKAVHESVDKLPSIIWGQESASNHSYHQSIKAIGFAHADVDLINEYWDHQNKTLRIEASVSWNEEKVLSTLKQVQAGEQAKRTVSQIEKILDGISAKDFIDSSAHRKLEEARLLASPFHFGMDLPMYVKRYNETLNEMIRIRRQRIIDFYNLIDVQPTGIRNQLMHYTMTFPALDYLTLSFESPDLQQFYNDNKQSIENTYDLCAVSPTPIISTQFDNSITMSIQTLKQISDGSKLDFKVKPTDEIISGLVKPIYFLTCSNTFTE